MGIYKYGMSLRKNLERRFQQEKKVGEDVIVSLTFSRDSTLLAAGSPSKILVWDIEKETELGTLTITATYSPALAFNDKKDSIVIATNDTLGVWKYKE